MREDDLIAKTRKIIRRVSSSVDFQALLKGIVKFRPQFINKAFVN